jgi:L-2-hydroxyglutarate oxidase LhgO
LFKGFVMKVDYLIVGAGIQGLVLVDRMRALGLNVCCVERAPYVGSAQTLRSQFYIHRGHFYTERELVGQLNNTYWNWQSMVRRLGVRIHSNESYVGFIGDSSPWTNAWDAEGVPYTRTLKKSGVLQDHRMQEVFTFPHMLVDGREFLVKLTHINRHHIRFGDLSNFRHTGRHYRFTLNGEELFARKIIVCAGAGTPAVLDSIEGVEGSVEVQTRVCQVLVMRDHVPDGSVLVPDAQMFIAPQ